MTSVFIGARATIFALAFMGGWFWVIRRVQPISREWDAALPLWATPAGSLLLITGCLGMVTCIALFAVEGRGTPAIFDPPRTFVAVGPYRYVRNPMYLSALAVFTGFGLYVRSVAVLAFAAAWWLMIQTFVLLVEEPGLRQRFGRAYLDYCKRVPRWVPHIGRGVSLAILVASVTSAQTAPADFSGTWTLNVGRSDFGPFRSPQQRVDTVELHAAVLKVSRREVTSSGQERTAEWECSTEQVACTNTVGGMPMKSTARWDDRTLVVDSTTTFQGLQAFLTDRWALSADARTLTITRHAVSPQGTADQTFVLDRR